MATGATGLFGRYVQSPAVPEARPGPGLATSQHLLMGANLALELTLRSPTATLNLVQVLPKI